MTPREFISNDDEMLARKKKLSDEDYLELYARVMVMNKVTAERLLRVIEKARKYDSPRAGVGTGNGP